MAHRTQGSGQIGTAKIERLEGRTLLSLPAATVANLAQSNLADSAQHSPSLLEPTFIDHGVAVPISVSRGAVGAVDGTGRDVFLMWMWDHRGCYGIIETDVLTGATTEVAIPGFPLSVVDGPYFSILYNNKFYTQFGYRFLEFDPTTRSFTKSLTTIDQRAMSMTVDDSGNIWSVSNPNCGVVKYNTASGTFTDFGPRYSQSFQQYPYYCATDDQGWLYIGDGTASSQILAVNPTTGATTALLSASERLVGTAKVYRNVNGKVYGRQLENSGTWYQLYGGVRTTLGSHTVNAKTYIAGNQNLFIGNNYASGRTVVSCNTVTRVLTYRNSGSSTNHTSNFTYTNEGAYVMSIVATPDGRIAGGGTFPMYEYELNTTTNAFTYSNVAGGQWNASYRRGNHVYVGSYPYGVLLDWDTTKPWTLTSSGTSSTNPKGLVIDSRPSINRPDTVYPTPDGKYVLMGGTPDYGLTGGGLVVYNLQTGTYVIRTDTHTIPNESPFSIVSLDATHVLIGTTVAPGTGGVQVSTNAHLYIMDLTDYSITWSGMPFSNAYTYVNMYMGANGLVYGTLDNDTFFTFNPTTHTIVNSQSLSAWGKSASSQGPRIFCDTPQGTFVLLNNYIAKLNFTTNLLELAATLPTAASVGLDYWNGRLYYVASDQSHIWSWKLPDVTAPQFVSSSFLFDGVSLPAAPHRVTLQFSEDVGASFGAADVQIVNATTGQNVAIIDSDIAWNSGANTATITFPGQPNKQLSDGNYTVTLSKPGITDAAGNALTGNSGFEFFVLSGDANRDRHVDSLDQAILTAHLNQAGSFSVGDFDYSGAVNATDQTILNNQLKLYLPAPGALPLLATTGDDAYKLRRESAAIVEIYAGAEGTPTYRLITAGVSLISFVAGDGNDSLTIDASNGLPLGSIPLTFDSGNLGTDTLAVIGTAGADAVTFNSTSLTLGSTISVRSVETRTFDGGGTDALTVNDVTVALTSNQKLSSLTLNASATLDLKDRRLVIDYTPGNSPLASITGSIVAGRAGGNWNQPGIVTSQTLAKLPSQLATLGVVEASGVVNFGASTTAVWRGETVDQSSVLVAYTFAGDANLDGAINGDDYFAIDVGFSSHAHSYFNGDFNYDGHIDADDYFLIDSSYNKPPPVLASAPAAFQTSELPRNEASPAKTSTFRRLIEGEQMRSILD